MKYNTGVYPTHVLHVYFYTCNVYDFKHPYTQSEHNQITELFTWPDWELNPGLSARTRTCNTLHIYTCITYVKMCITDVLLASNIYIEPNFWAWHETQTYEISLCSN